MHISKADTFMKGINGGFHTIPWLKILLKGYKISDRSLIYTLQCILLPCDTICDSAVFHVTAHDNYANSTYEQHEDS